MAAAWWSWTQHHRYRRRYQHASADPANAHLEFIRLRTPGQVAALIARVRAQSSPPRETAPGPR